MRTHIRRGTFKSSQGTYQSMSFSQSVFKPRHLVQGSERMNILLLLQFYLVSNDNIIHQEGMTLNSSPARLRLCAQRVSVTLFSESQSHALKEWLAGFSFVYLLWVHQAEHSKAWNEEFLLPIVQLKSETFLLYTFGDFRKSKSLKYIRRIKTARNGIEGLYETTKR